MTIRGAGSVALIAAALVGCRAGAEARGAPVTSSMENAGPACRPDGEPRTLAAEIRATSGLVESRSEPGVLWTHNDSENEPVLFALDTGGTIRSRVRVRDASLIDWEDMESGPCGAGTCLYIADTGDNFRERDSVTIYAVPEPTWRDSIAEPARVLHARYPDGPQDNEALVILGSRLFLVTKGRHAAIALYRFPDSVASGRAATLVRIRELFPQPADSLDRVMAATASPDGRWVAVRTYRTLYLYPAADLVSSRPVTPSRVDLTPLGEIQGEAIALDNAGRLWLTSEAELEKDLPALYRMRCSLSR